MEEMNPSIRGPACRIRGTLEHAAGMPFAGIARAQPRNLRRAFGTRIENENPSSIWHA